jgi:prepilin-type processing-associated H-X9-DG protein
VAGNLHVLPVATVRPPAMGRLGDYGDLAQQLESQGMRTNVFQVKDGSSNTILFGTVTRNFKPWGHPANVRDPSLGVNRSPDGFGAPANWDGAQFAFCDGSVRMLSSKTDPRVLKQLATPAGGEDVVDGADP